MSRKDPTDPVPLPKKPNPNTGHRWRVIRRQRISFVQEHSALSNDELRVQMRTAGLIGKTTPTSDKWINTLRKAPAPAQGPTMAERIAQGRNRDDIVAGLIVLGHTNKQIAELTNTKLTAVAKSVRRVYRRHNAKDRIDYVRKQKLSVDPELSEERLLFSPRDYKVGKMLLKGWVLKQVASELGLCINTIGRSVYRLYNALGAKSRAGFVRLWLQHESIIGIKKPSDNKAT